VLDVGCFDGTLFWQASHLVRSGVGIDVARPVRWPAGAFEFRLGEFPEAAGEGEVFDCVVMLAVVEHVPDNQLADWSGAVTSLVRPGGRVIITTPSPVVDRILDAGIRLRLLKGMEAGQHHGFDPRRVPAIFGSEHLRLRHQRRFELGLNHLFVFERTT
jgi:2-polyprenyl-3-methyl-5-hydroxy-6-metoxy-1,4-benzoquinol methylase